MTTHIRLYPGEPTLCGSDSENWTYAKRKYRNREMCEECLNHEEHGMFQLRVMDDPEKMIHLADQRLKSADASQVIRDAMLGKFE